MAIPAHATETRLTIGPDTLSFPQLAAQLSIDGRVVECTPDLQDNAAFVSLKNRDWKQVTKLLSEALAVRFVPLADKPATYRMEPDPKVMAREQRFRKRLFQNAEAEFQRMYGVLRNYSLRDYPRIRAQYEALNKAERALVSSIPSSQLQTSPEFQETTRRRQELGRLLPDFPAAWLSTRLFRSGRVGTWEEVFRRGEIVTVINVRDILGDQPPEQLGLSPTQSLLICRFSTRGSLFGVGTVAFSLHQLEEGERKGINGGFQVSLPHQFSALFHDDPRITGRPVPYLGEEAETWFKQECRTMEAFLQSPRARKPVPSPNKTNFTDFSTLIEAHSRTLDAETIMELWPQREMITEFNIGIDRDLQNQRTPPPEPGPGGVNPIVFTPHPSRQQKMDNRFLKNEAIVAGNSLHTIFSDNLVGAPGAWTLREQDSVLLVTNRLAFLDRQNRFPIRAFLPLAKKWNAYLAASGYSEAVPLEMLRDYAFTVSPEQNHLWEKELYQGYYRGVPMRRSAEGAILVKLWYQLPERTRRELLAKARPEESATLSGRDISPRMLEELQQAIRLHGPRMYPHVWLPDYMRYLRDGQLVVSLTIRPLDSMNREKVNIYTLQFQPRAVNGIFSIEEALKIDVTMPDEHRRAQQKP